jgi:hypothetical protein
MTKATTFKNLRTATNGLQPVDKGDRISSCAHAKRRRNTAEPGTNHQNIAVGSC